MGQDVQIDYQIRASGGDQLAAVAENQRKVQAATEEATASLQKQAEASSALAGVSQATAEALAKLGSNPLDLGDVAAQTDQAAQGVRRLGQTLTDEASRIATAQQRVEESVQGFYKSRVKQPPPLSDESVAKANELFQKAKEQDALKERTKLEQLLARIVQQGQDAELTGMQKLEVRRQKALDQLRGIAGAEEKVNASFAAQGRAEQKRSDAASTPFNFSNIRQAIADPFYAGAQAAESLASKLGAAGVAAVGVAAGVALVAKEIFGLVQAEGKAAEEVQNLSLRTGLSVQETQLLSGAAKVAGVDVNGLASAMKLLAPALTEAGTEGKKAREGLRKLGVEPLDSGGNVKGTFQLITEISNAIQNLPPAERVTRLTEALGRQGQQLAPLLAALPEILGRYQAAVGTLTDDTVKKLGEADDALDILEAKWKLLKGTFAAGIVGAVRVVYPEGFESDPAKIRENALRAAQRREEVDNSAFGPLGGRPQAAGPEISLANPDRFAVGSQASTLARAAQKDAVTAKDNVTALGAALQQTGSKADQLREAVKTAKDELTKARAAAEQLKEAGGSGTTDTAKAQAAIAQVNKASANVVQAEADLKALSEGNHKYEEAKHKVEAAEKQASEAGLTGAAKVLAKNDELLREVGKYAELRDRVAKITAKELANEGRKATAKDITAAAGLTEKQITAADDGPAEQEQLINDLYRSRVDTALRLLDLAKQEASTVTDGNEKALILMNGEAQAAESIKRAAIERQAAELALEQVRKRATERTGESLETGAIDQNAALTRARIAGLDPFSKNGDELSRIEAVKNADLAAVDARYQVRLKYQTFEEANGQRELEQAAVLNKAELDGIEATNRKKREAIEIGVQGVRTNAERQARLIELTAQPGSEEETINRLHDLRVAAIQSEYDLTHDRKTAIKALDDAEFDRAAKLLELRKKETEEFKSQIGTLLEDVQSKGAQGLQNYFTGLGKSIEKSIVENLAGIGFEKFRDQLPSISGQRKRDANGNETDEPTLLGKILAGTPFGRKASAPVNPAQVEANAKLGLATTATTHLASSTDLLRGSVDALRQQLATKAGTAGIAGGAAGVAGAAAKSASSIDDVTGDGADEDGSDAGTDEEGNPLGQGGLPGGSNGDYGGETNNPVDLGGSGGSGSDTGSIFSKLANKSPLSTVFDSDASTSSRIGAGLGAAGAVAGGVMGILSGINKGGARGVTSALGSGLGAAAVLAGGPTNPIGLALTLGALGSQLVGSLFGDPRAQYAKKQDEELQSLKGQGLTQGVDVVESTSGQSISHDYKGNLRVLNSTPEAQNYQQVVGFDPYHSTDGKPNPVYQTDRRLVDTPLPGSSLDQSAAAATTRSQAAPTTINNYSFENHISAMDSKSILDRSADIASAWTKAINSDHAPARQAVADIANPR